MSMFIQIFNQVGSLAWWSVVSLLIQTHSIIVTALEGSVDPVILVDEQVCLNKKN